MNQIAVIGGGASGMLAAIAAARSGGNVTIYERFDRLGKKILATGNGRCNLTNIFAEKERYYGSDTKFLEYAINNFWVDKTLNLFSELGLLYKVEEEGRVYPYSDAASSVLDLLRFEIERLGIQVEYNFEVEAIRKNKDGFSFNSYQGAVANANSVIVATGGKASPSLGSNGGGYTILEGFGHKLTKLTPSLVQIKLKNNPFKPLNGLKTDAVIAFDGMKISGEVLFTDYGISGPAVFAASSKLCRKTSARLTLDLMSDYSITDIVELLKARRRLFKTIDELFCGIFVKRIGQVIIKNAVNYKLNEDINRLSDADLNKIADKVKDFTVEADGTMSWNNAQVTAGGIEVSGFDPETMESRLVKGLYAVGELLDIDGDCGGFNLQWAWSSGYIAGVSAAGGRI